MPAPDETSRTDSCDSNFLEDIGNKMTIPRRLQVVSEPENVAESRTKMPMLQTGDCDGQHRLNANLMEVPDRIVLADGAKSRPKGLSWESFSAEGVLKEQLLLRTPPRVLTLQEQPLDYISLDPAPFHSTASQSEAAGRRMVSSRPRRRRSVSENGMLQSPRTQPYSSSLDLSANDSQLMDAMHGTEVDILTLHRQVLRLHQRLRATEHAQEKSARRDVLLCSAMAILLLINGWFWLRR